MPNRKLRPLRSPLKRLRILQVVFVSDILLLWRAFTKIPLIEKNYRVDEEPPTQYAEKFIVPSPRNFQVPEDFLGRDPLSKCGCKLQKLRSTGERYISTTAYCNAIPAILNLLFHRRVTDWCNSRRPDGESSDDKSN
ncbi:hypothetical protein DFH09DRAFT_1107700 [Mycena vulgaris]|nr:hypothetical protein DFH09DRAFT_1107700 [Mycena vulgaris]